jgi:2-succinyl-6-hydroxy-2,4-cyclohexadiene-1-carboxylate synthase
MPCIDVLGVPHTYELTHPVESGATLVFVHGWLLSRRYWKPLIQSLAPSHQCLAYDLRGFGDSAGSSVGTEPTLVAQDLAGVNSSISCLPQRFGYYTPAAYAYDLVTLLAQLQQKRVWLIGHSLGGSIALWAAALAPQQVAGVVCLNFGGGIYVKESFERFRAAGQQMLWFRPPWLAHTPLLDVVFSRLMVTQPLSRQWGKQRMIDFVRAQPEAARRTLLDSTLSEEVHRLPQVVAQLQQPVYFLAGQQDQVMELKYVYHLASFHQDFFQGQSDRVLEIPQCGHMGMLEQTTVVSQHLCTILSQQDSAMDQDTRMGATSVATKTAVPNE